MSRNTYNKKNNITFSMFLLYICIILSSLFILHYIFCLIFKYFLNLEIRNLKKKSKNIEFKFGQINRKKFKIFKSYFNIKKFLFKNKYISLEGNVFLNRSNKIIIYNDNMTLSRKLSYYYFYHIELDPINKKSFIKYKIFCLFFWRTKKIKIDYKETPVHIFKICDECIICFENKIINIPISVCGHVGFCYECYKKLDECPYCRNNYLESSGSSYSGLETSESSYSSFDDY
jgi:hypothetical protein